MFKKFLKNSSYNFVGWLIPLATNIFTIPFYINQLTAEVYGIWILMGSFTGYLALVQLGASPALIKYVAEYKAKQDDVSLNGIINVSFAYLIVIGIISAGVIIALAGLFSDLVNIPPIYRDVTIDSLQIIGCAFGISLILNAFTAVFTGFQRFEVSNFFSTGRFVGTTVLSLFFISNGLGLWGMSMSFVIGNISALLIGFLLLKRVYPTYRIGLRGTKKFVRTIFSFSSYAFISQLARLLTTKMPELLIGYVLGPEAVTFYSVPTRLVTLFTTGTSSISQVIFPFTSELVANNDVERLRKSYLQSVKYFNLIIAPFYLVFMFFSEYILKTWINKDLSNSSWIVMTVASATFLISSLTTIPSQYLLGFGKVKFIAFFSIGVAGISISAIYPFTVLGGVIGASIAVLATQTFGILFIIYANRLLRITLKQLAGTWFPVLTASLLVIPFLILSKLFAPTLGNQGVVWGIIPVYFLAYSIICLLSSKLIDRNLRDLIVKTITVFIKSIKIGGKE